MLSIFEPENYILLGAGSQEGTAVANVACLIRSSPGRSKF